MSADKWKNCPWCAEQTGAKKREERRLAEAAYGEVEMDEFLRMKAEADKPAVPMKETFRMDYEIYLDGKSVMVNYSGYCEVCHKGTEFSERHPMEYEKLS